MEWEEPLLAKAYYLDAFSLYFLDSRSLDFDLYLFSFFSELKTPYFFI